MIKCPVCGNYKRFNLHLTSKADTRLQPDGRFRVNRMDEPAVAAAECGACNLRLPDEIAHALQRNLTRGFAMVWDLEVIPAP